MRDPHQIDAVIVGGGPAGAVAARLLASWGRSVLLIHRQAGTPALAESLPASARKLLAFLGVLETIDAARFQPNFGNVGAWAGAPRATRSDEPGVHVDRSTFDRLLRRSAEEAGATIVDGAVRRVTPGHPLTVEYVTARGDRVSCRARYALDCSGRAGVLARQGWRRIERGYRTLAMTAEWMSDTWAADEQSRTVIDSYADGWAWSVPLSRSRRQVTVMVEPTLVGRHERRSLYGRELAKAQALVGRLSGARQIGQPWTCDASLYDATQTAGDGVLLVGDAASFIEPLSSAGVKKALASAWRASVVLNTCLSTPSMEAQAFAFFDRREREVHAECRQRCAEFFAEAAAAYRTPFWSARAGSASTPLSPADAITEERLVRDPRVRAALDMLRRGPSVRLRPGRVRLEPTPTIEGRELVMRDALVLPGVAVPVRFAAGVNLPALVALTRERGEMASLFAAYERAIGPIAPDGLLTGVSLLVAHHALINEGSAL